MPDQHHRNPCQTASQFPPRPITADVLEHPDGISLRVGVDRARLTADAAESVAGQLLRAARRMRERASVAAKEGGAS